MEEANIPLSNAASGVEEEDDPPPPPPRSKRVLEQTKAENPIAPFVSEPSKVEEKSISVPLKPEVIELNENLECNSSAVAEENSVTFMPTCLFLANGKRIDQNLWPVKKVDFKQPIIFSDIEFEQLKQRYEAWLRSLAARLSMLLRMDFGLKLRNFKIVPYGKFLDSLPTPSHLILFKVDQWNGIGLLHVSVSLVMLIVNRMLGGKAQILPEERFLTDIEVALIDEVVQLFLEEWCNTWKGWMGPLMFEKVGVENSPRFIQNPEADFSLVTAELEGTFGGCTNSIKLALPCGMMQPIIQKLKERKKAITVQENTNEKWVWRDAYENINVHFTADWKAGSFSVKKLTELKVGEMIKLPTEILRHTLINMQGSCKFIGEVGLQKGRIAVKIVKKCENNDGKS